MMLRLVLASLLLLGSSHLLAKNPDVQSVPISGVFSGYLMGFNYDPFDIAERCPNLPDGKYAWAITSFAGQGIVTHLGETLVEANHCSYGTIISGPDGTYGQGAITMVADNGDILLSTYDNGVSLSPPPLIGFMDYVTFVDGGTGRFAFASGEAVEMGEVNFIDGSFTMQMSGGIAYKRK